MKLQEIFDGLSSGEFSQISIGGQHAGVINEQNFKQVITHINLGLAALYRRFHIKENRLQVALQPGQKIYPLKSEFAVTGRNAPGAVRYILDSISQPFHDDIMKITRVLTDKGDDIILNDAADLYSIRTPTLTAIVVPDAIANQTEDTPTWLKTEQLTVIYRAAAPVLKIPLGLFDPSRIKLELPYTYLEALLYFVGSRVHNPIGMANEFHAGNNYAAKYEQACLDLVMSGVDVEQGGGNMRLQRKGFV